MRDNDQIFLETLYMEMTSEDSSLKAEFDKIKQLFDDYPKNSIQAKKMGFEMQEIKGNFCRWIKDNLLYGLEWGEDLLLDSDYRHSIGVDLFYYENNKRKYDYSTTTYVTEYASIYLYDKDFYSENGLKDVEYIRKRIQKLGNNYSKTYYIKYENSVSEERENNKNGELWFLEYNPNTIKRSKEKGFDLSPISKEEF